MPENFDPFLFADHLRSRWRLFALSAGVAVALAAVITLAQAKQYTAVTRLVIDPPAAIDPRAAMAVSPIYFESLRTYEHFAMSDSVFERAVEKFGLRRSDPGRPIESWKKRVLRVEIPRNTKILEIRVTLPDAKKAHEMARFLADETVKLNQAVNLEGDRELTQGADAELDRARQERDQARAAYAALAQTQPLDALESALQSLKSQQFAVERDLLDAEILAAEMTEGAGPARKRAAHLRAERNRIGGEITGAARILSARTAAHEQAKARVKTAEEACDAIEMRLREARGAAGHRGERLRLIDPGVVPERPSSPNGPLNVVVAFLAAMAGSAMYASVEFGMARRGSPPVAIPLRVAGRRGDD